MSQSEIIGAPRTFPATIAAPAPALADGDRIRYGARPSQTMPAAWASFILTELASRHGAMFRTLIGRASYEADGAE